MSFLRETLVHSGQKSADGLLKANRGEWVMVRVSLKLEVLGLGSADRLRSERSKLVGTCKCSSRYL